MRRLFTVAALAAALAVPAVPAAAPNPNCCSDPYNQFVVTRVLPNLNEVTLAVYSLDAGYTSDQVIRQAVYEFARTERLNNPAWVVVIYGPIDPPQTFYTNGDRIWDSRYNY